VYGYIKEALIKQPKISRKTSMLKEFIRNIILKMGFSVRRVSSHSSGLNFVEDCGRYFSSSDGLVIFDVGANQGQTSERFRAQFPFSKIYAFEPATKTCQKLAEKFTFDTKIFIHNCGVGSEVGQLRLALHDNSELNSFRDGDKCKDESVDSELCEVITIDKFCEDSGISEIDILKSDTEGFDVEVIKGAKNILSAGSIKVVIVEATFDDGDNLHSNFYEIALILRNLEYQLLGLYDVHFRQGSGRIYHFNALFYSKKMTDKLHLLEALK
jgi:FkbM family methyltransferase